MATLLSRRGLGWIVAAAAVLIQTKAILALVKEQLARMGA